MLNTAEATVLVDKLEKPTLEDYREQIYEKEKIVDEVTEIEIIEGKRTYEVVTEDGYVFQIIEIIGKSVNDLEINYEGTEDNLPIKMYKTGIEVDATTGKGKVSVELKRAEGATSYTYLYKEKDVTTDYIGTEGNGTGTTFTYELQLGKIYLFKAIVDDKETEPIEVELNQPVTGITINKTEVKMIQGATFTLTATISPSNASNKELTWTSSDSSLVTISETGLTRTITASEDNVGTTTITISANDGSGFLATCNVTVIEQSTLSKLVGKTAISTNQTVEDEYGNKVVVPAGFTVVAHTGTTATDITYSYTDTIGNSPTVQDGVVIQDTEGNQFVWVPVGEIKDDTQGNTTTITLGRYNSFTMGADGTLPTPVQKASDYNINNNSTLISIVHSDATRTYQEYAVNASYANTKATNLGQFVTNTQLNGGYYMARYEASYGTDGKADSKSATRWGNITQPNAAKAAKAMYTSEYFVSDLINSYAWDTTIVFIQKYSEYNNYANMSIASSTTDKVCNIYNMASAGEWSTETCLLYSGYACVLRGGNSNASWRWDHSTSQLWASVSFRVLLYVK